MSFKSIREGKMYKTILLCDTCEKEMARGEATVVPRQYTPPPIGSLTLGGGVSVYESDGPRQLANLSVHACSKTCARAALSKLQSAIEDSSAREKP